MDKPVADVWFGFADAGDGVSLVREAHIDPYLSGNMWLVRGRDAALLVDTGTGIMPMKGLLESMAGMPVMAVALNRYYDHAGGLYEFDERLAHRLEAPALAAPDGKSSVSDDYVSDGMLRALPYAGFSTNSYAMRGAPVTRQLEDGDIIDLGGRELAVIHFPGTTEGSICLWEAASGILFTGDSLYRGPRGELPLAPLRADYRESLGRIRDLPVRIVHPGHFGSLDPAAAQDVISRYR